jgi:hypothetical protein
MLRLTKDARGIGATKFESWLWRHAGRLCALACVAVFAMASGTGWLCGYAQSPQGQAPATPESSASTQAPAQAPQDKQQTGSAPADPRKQEVASECADLLKMAEDLKTEVDKTTKDTLSVTVVRKASEIEQLARKVRTGTGKS